MIKTQIQLPNTLYKQLKNVASEREWSLAETLRRAAELFLATQPSVTKRSGGWKLPTARHCGDFLVPEEKWTELAHDE